MIASGLSFPRLMRPYSHVSRPNCHAQFLPWLIRHTQAAVIVKTLKPNTKTRKDYHCSKCPDTGPTGVIAYIQNYDDPDKDGLRFPSRQVREQKACHPHDGQHHTYDTISESRFHWKYPKLQNPHAERHCASKSPIAPPTRHYQVMMESMDLVFSKGQQQQDDHNPGTAGIHRQTEGAWIVERGAIPSGISQTNRHVLCLFHPYRHRRIAVFPKA